MNIGGTIRLNKVGVAVICGLLIIFVLYISPRSDEVEVNIKVNLRRLLIAAIVAAERGGKEVVKVINQANLKQGNKGKTKDGVVIPVTNADEKSHCVMYNGISKMFPSVKIISEEEVKSEDCQQFTPLEIEFLEKNPDTRELPDFEVNSDQITVWIDPLDATKEYTEHLFDYVTTMVCVAYQGNPIIGIIHKPFAKEPKTTWAWIEKGMSSNLKKRNPKKSDKNTVILSRSHPGQGVEEKVKNVFGKDTEIIRAGGSGYKSLEVAVGNVTAYIHTNQIQKWDICAGDAIINSLHGSFTSLNGENIDYSSSSNPIHMGGLLAMMSDHNIYIQKLNTT